jgi:Holliday junction DNA helicase RuvA
MIAMLRGELHQVEGGRAILDVNGVGYEVSVGPNHATDLLPGTDLVLFISTQVREDAITLFGFPTTVERKAFDTLLAVSGVGPKLALGVVDSLGVDGLARAVHTEDLRAIMAVPGVGRKTAQRLVLELKGKLVQRFAPTRPTITPPPGNPPLVKDPLRLALAKLGYRKSEIDMAEQGIRGTGQQDAPLAERLSTALNILSRGR